MKSLDDLVPIGLYCYTLLPTSNEKGIPQKCTCQYWSLKSPGVGACKLVGDDDDGEGDGLLWAQVKECGINTEEDETKLV